MYIPLKLRPKQSLKVRLAIFILPFFKSLLSLLFKRLAGYRREAEPALPPFKVSSV